MASSLSPSQVLLPQLLPYEASALGQELRQVEPAIRLHLKAMWIDFRCLCRFTGGNRSALHPFASLQLFLSKLDTLLQRKVRCYFARYRCTVYSIGCYANHDIYLSFIIIIYL